MMYTAALVLASLAAASPMASQPGSDYPEKFSSQGFHLVVNNTDLSRELPDPVHHMFLSSIHIGPPSNLLGTSSTAETPRVFYQNATEDEFRSGHGHILSDGGSPRISYGLSSRLEENVADAFVFRLDAGPGQHGVAISPGHHPYAFLKVPGLALCNEPVKYHNGKRMNILKQFPNPTGTLWKMPEECVPVRLLPQCTQLEDAQQGAMSSHEFVQTTHCYKNVSAINWSTYTPFDQIHFNSVV
ncbi:hypothetical protein MAC_01715 [Metarhizium acridum CQMa 102]|uniref:DUF7907 domain-containing protein n=1 Tax=Metarhizium acridum (strain CQMa 102) TaxID=655827 RepID=E9DVR7_METAQ|nr:uncharacterized protein MAC_01715 [Metarhizium acridum CQMa 102]EFY92114.1 hypothetical protein MAC_01715 [Metarhizium acridum CQMa 102]